MFGIALVILVEAPISGQGNAYASFSVPSDACELSKQHYTETLLIPEAVYQTCNGQCVDKNSMLIVSYKEHKVLWWKWLSDENCIKK